MIFRPRYRGMPGGPARTPERHLSAAARQDPSSTEHFAHCVAPMTLGTSRNDQGPFPSARHNRNVPAVDIETVKSAVVLACRAPSIHNSQPWRWIVEHDAVHLFADRNRTVRATDHSGRDALISCGATLDHLQVAMAAAGWRAGITRFPDPNEPAHLATLRFRPIDHVTAAQTQSRRSNSAALHRSAAVRPPDVLGPFRTGAARCTR